MHFTRNYDFSAGTTIVADQVDQEFNSIRAVLNGNVDDSNLRDACITTAKIVEGSVITSKIANNAVTAEKTEELPKCVDRKNHGSSVVVTDQLIQTGWAYVMGQGGVDYTQLSTIIFPIPFDENEVPIVTITPAGNSGTTLPTKPGQPSGSWERMAGGIGEITNTGFKVRMGTNNGETMATNVYYMFTWIAIGKKAR
jgi:hypothetical protein